MPHATFFLSDSKCSTLAYESLWTLCLLHLLSPAISQTCLQTRQLFSAVQALCRGRWEMKLSLGPIYQLEEGASVSNSFCPLACCELPGLRSLEGPCSDYKAGLAVTLLQNPLLSNTY